MLYELLVGHAPLGTPESAGGAASSSGFTVHDILYHQMHTLPQPPTQFRADIPPWLEAICLKLLAKRPEDRFPTPDALLTALRTETSAPEA